MIDFITTNTTYHDRQVLHITPITDGYSNYDNTTVSKWAICDGELIGPNHKYVGVLAAHTSKEFSVRGTGIIITTPGYYVQESMYASVVPGVEGHLSYIDGCSNTGLVGPLRNGDPCINYLYFPPGIEQTMHTHPSCRIGMILSGEGIAEVGNKFIPLNAGKIFLLHKHVKHRFITKSTSMSIMVFHPDSDAGPRDEVNPMKSRTYL